MYSKQLRTKSSQFVYCVNSVAKQSAWLFNCITSPLSSRIQDFYRQNKRNIKLTKLMTKRSKLGFATSIFYPISLATSSYHLYDLIDQKSPRTKELNRSVNKWFCDSQYHHIWTGWLRMMFFGHWLLVHCSLADTVLAGKCVDEGVPHKVGPDHQREKNIAVGATF